VQLPPAALPLPGESVDLDATLAVLFTSGTSGRAKGACLGWGQFLASARGAAECLGDVVGRRWLASLPLYHVGGLSLAFTAAAGKAVGDHTGQGPWSLQTGLEFVGARRHLNDRASHFAAIDVRTYQETDWSARVTVQAGYWIPVGNRSSVHRLAVELGTGRSVMSQFLWQDETWLGIGWYYDF
jgi:acyl-CoA synthetase (AMP-forming)/AMP-acid ligase II